MLFTTLYGIYPCNFTAFLREPVPYLQEKGWKGAHGDGRIDLASGIVRSKSEASSALLCELCCLHLEG